jgi:hypothetical protein
MEKHLPCQSQSDSAQPFLEGSRVILSSNEVLKYAKGISCSSHIRTNAACLPNRTDVIQKRCGAVVGLGVGSKMGTGSRLRHIERRGDPMNRTRSRLVMDTAYDGCALASAQYCSVSGNILTGNFLERIKLLPCRVSAATVAESQQGFPVG